MERSISTGRFVATGSGVCLYCPRTDIRAYGLCEVHYKRWRTGRPMDAPYYPTRVHAASYKRVRIDGVVKRQHRVLMAERLGRELQPWEVVHHKDGNPRNNDPDNLKLVSWVEHSKIHMTLGEI